MAKRIRDIQISQDELKEMAEIIKAKFYGETKIMEPFTGSVKSSLYEKLSNHITNSVSGFNVVSPSTLRNIILLKHNGKFQSTTYSTLKEYISSGELKDPVPEQIFWGVNYSPEPGAFINSVKGKFIPWIQLKKELEERVICRCPRLIPVTSKAELADFHGHKNWVIWVVNAEGDKIASVWIGGDPERNWLSDGKVRLGRTISDNEWEVYQIFTRFSDGSYRMEESRV